MKHIKKTYTKFNGDYVLENIETFENGDIGYFIFTNNYTYTYFNGGYVFTVIGGDKMTKNIFLT